MKLQRRRFLQLAAGVTALRAAPLAWAQTYPWRPVRIIVGFSSGDPNDIVARLVGQWLSERLGQPFVIENRPGANGNIGTEAVVKASPDGHTLLFFGASMATINPMLFERVDFVFVRDIVPVATILRLPQVMTVHPSVPAKTVPEFISYAQANPRKLNYASPGIGSIPHVAGELFKMMAGITMTHVPYRGAANALTDLLAGQVQLMFTGAAGEYIRDSRLRPLP